MFTGTLAMLHRAIRLDARLVRTHLFRAGFALMVYGGLVVANFSSAMTLVGAPGLKLFTTMMYLNLILISLAGISFFATAITEEKEEETLGLLKMAGIDPLGILLGKSTSRLLGANLLLLVQFPFTLLAITLGGVTLGQVLAAYCSLAAYMILLANVGLFCSVRFRRGGTASSVTLILLVVYFFAATGIRGVRFGLVHGDVLAGSGAIAGALEQTANWFQAASVADRIDDIMQTGFADKPVGFQVVVSLAGALLFFFIAWIGFDRFTRAQRVVSQRSASLLAWLIRFGRRYRTRPGAHLMAWKEYHFVAGGMPVQIVKFVFYGLITITIFSVADRYYDYSFAKAGELVADVMLGVIVLESGLYASVLFHDEWRDRTLPLLTMLPIRLPTIMYSKIAGCAPALIPALFWLVAGCLIWPDGLAELAKCLYLPSRWFYALVWLLFLTLTVFFSLVVRWGALPLALAVMAGGSIVAGCCGFPIMGLFAIVNQGNGSAEPGFLLVDVVIGVLIALLQVDVRRRIEIASWQ